MLKIHFYKIWERKKKEVFLQNTKSFSGVDQLIWLLIEDDGLIEKKETKKENLLQIEEFDFEL